MVGELEEDLLHSFLLLSIFPGSFSTLAAAEVLGLAGITPLLVPHKET